MKYFKSKTIRLSHLFTSFLVIICIILVVFSWYVWTDFWFGSLAALLIMIGYFLPFFLFRIVLQENEILFIIPAGFFGIKEGHVKYEDIKEIVISRTTPFYKERLTGLRAKVTWREKLIINNSIVLPGLYVSGLEQLIARIKMANPSVRISDHSNTVMENIAENKDYFTKYTFLELVKFIK